MKVKTRIPFSQQELENNLVRFAAILKKRVRADWDAVVCISGEEGSGKSALAYWLGKQIDPNFDFERNELFSVNYEGVLEKVTDPKIKVIVGDEAIKWLYKRLWATKGQIFINQLYTLCRKENKITVLCIPRFGDLNEYFRNHRVKFWIYNLTRGLAVLFCRDWSPFTVKDPWWINENQKIIDRIRMRTYHQNVDLKKKIKMLSKCRGFLMVLAYPDFPKDAKARYEEVKNKYVYEGEAKKERQAEESLREKKDRIIQLNLIRYLICHDKKSLKDVSQITGLNTNTIKRWIQDEEWWKEYQQQKLEKLKNRF